MGKPTVQFAPREVINDQLLAALDDKSKVAIVLSRDDLDMLIDALIHRIESASLTPDSAFVKKRSQFLEDMRELRRKAF